MSEIGRLPAPHPMQTDMIIFLSKFPVKYPTEDVYDQGVEITFIIEGLENDPLILWSRKITPLAAGIVCDRGNNEHDYYTDAQGERKRIPDSVHWVPNWCYYPYSKIISLEQA